MDTNTANTATSQVAGTIAQSILIPAGTIVSEVYSLPKNGGIAERLVTLQGDAIVDATRQDDGCWGYTVGGSAYVCAGGCGFPV